MNHILVTGSNGQLGNELKLLTNLLPQSNFLFHDIDTLDISNLDALSIFFQKTRPSFIINCAAYTAVDKAESESEKAFLINDKSVGNLAKIAVEFNSKIIHISTDYVYDGNTHIPYIETSATNPLSIYGKSKLKGEKHLESVQNALIIRTAWLYSNFGNNFVKTMIRIGKEKKELRVVYDQVGSPTYAADLAQTIIYILKLTIEQPDKFISGIYHYSNEGVCSWFDFANEIIQYLKMNCIVLPILTKDYPTPTHRPAYSVFDKTKIKTTFGIQIPWWKESLINCLNKLKLEVV